MTVLDLTADEYHADATRTATPTLSSGIVKLLCTKTPLHAWAAHPRLNPDYQPTHDDKFDVGTACHSLLLQGIDLVHVVDANDWRTKDAKLERDSARGTGKIPLLTRQWDEVSLMLDAVRQQVARLPIKPPPFTNGTPEQTIVWNEAGVMCRARLDWLHADALTIDDLKTTSVDFDRWTRKTMWENGYALQAAWYQRGVQSVYGVTFCDFRFVLAEVAPPYAVSVVDLAPSALSLANEQIDYALATWRQCLETDTWPAYPLRIATVEAPAWLETRWYERQAAILEAAA